MSSRTDIRFHRWSCRGPILISFASVYAGLYFGLLLPCGGLGEASAIAVFGGFSSDLVRAYLAIGSAARKVLDEAACPARRRNFAPPSGQIVRIESS